ncbi:ATP-NAD kinase domain-containing protein [Salix suchowensis]|nr:ATP-NAD kinase domain-containing protein [Salix suchowensis]
MYLVSSTDDEGDLLSARGLKVIGTQKVAELMRVSVHVEKPHESIPGVTVGTLGGPMYDLVQLITNTLNETGRVLVDTGYPDLGSFVIEALKEGTIWNAIICTVPNTIDGAPTCLHGQRPAVNADSPWRDRPLRVTTLLHISQRRREPPQSIKRSALRQKPPSPSEGPILSVEQVYVLRASAIDACEMIIAEARASVPSKEGVEWIKDITLPELDMWIWGLQRTDLTTDNSSDLFFARQSFSRDINRRGSGRAFPRCYEEAERSHPGREIPRHDTSASHPGTLAAHMPPNSPYHPSQKPIASPCFIHSFLDKGGSLTDWLRHQQQRPDADVGVANGLQKNRPIPHPQPNMQLKDLSPISSSSPTAFSHEDEEALASSSLTRQLAETAVGVREMSRARVRSNIQNVLVITKARDNRLIKLTRELALYLMMKKRPGQARGLTVSSSASSSSSLSTGHSSDDQMNATGQLRYWTSDVCSSSPHLFDFVVTLGGDGTVLFTSWLFQRIVPPVLPFALGSLGFLTNFDFADYQAVMDSAIDSGIRVNLRMRFTCTVYRAVAHGESKRRKAVKKGETGEIMMKNIEKGGWEALEGGWSGNYGTTDGKSKDKEIMCFTTRPAESFEVLNDLVVDRGPSPYVSLLELFGDEHHMTTVQADGLTVSTPTGSTAYSLSAGGSLVHPEIPALLITPICPHTLSFRPMLLPDSMELRICVPFNSRSTAWASFDGRGRVELKQGDHIKVTASKYPFPTVCADKQSTDWFHSISRTLKWNERERQKSFVVVEEGPAKPATRRRSNTTTPGMVKSVPNSPEDEEIDDEEDEVSEEEEEDKYDIDDSSPEAAAAKQNSQQTSPIHSSDSNASSSFDATALPKRTNRLLTTAIKQGLRRHSKSRSRSRSRVRSGVSTPGRYAGPQAHPPRSSPRHVGFTAGQSSPEGSEFTYHDGDGQRGTRDDLRATKRPSGKNRIPDRDVDADMAKTPTVSAHLEHGRSRTHDRSISAEYHAPRAFAVWGHDESDSNTSDSDR